MQVPVSATLIILFLGSVLLAPLLFLPTLRHGASVAMYKRWFGWPVLLMFALLFWPTDSGQVYSSGGAFGVQRLVRIVIMCGLFLVLLPRFLRERIWLRKSILNWYLLYVVACIVSVAYAPDWREALWKSFELLVILMVAAVTRADLRRGVLSLDDILSMYVLLLFVIVLFAIVGWLAFPAYGYGQWTFAESDYLSQSLGGIVPRANPNSLGQFSAMVLFVGMAGWASARTLRKESLIFIAVGGVVLVLAHARTSVAAVALLIVLTLILSKRTKAKILLLPMLVVGALGAGAAIEYFIRGQDIEVFQSLSGRTYMWAIAWQSIIENPWFGVGLAGHKNLDITVGMEYSTLDSTYIEALVNVGLVGASFLFLFIVFVLIRMAKIFIRSARASTPASLSLTIAAGFVFLMFVRSLAGPSFQSLHWNLLVLLTVIVAALESGPRRTACRPEWAAIEK